VDREGSFSIDRNGRIIRFSSTLRKVFGYDAGEVVGRRLVDLVPEELRAHAEGLVEEASRTGSVSGRRMKLLGKDGAAVEVYLSVYPLRDRTGALHSFLITAGMDKSAAVPALFTTEFQRIFKYSNDAVTITDADGSIIDVNPAFLETYGYKKEEVLGRNPRFLKSEHSTPEMYERMWSDLLDPEKGFWQGELINLTRDGREVPMLLSINAIKDSSGRIRNFLGIAFNMTGQKELARLNSLYVDYVLHDIKGPLMTVALNAEHLLGELRGRVPEKTIKRVKSILDSVRSVENMALDMLEFSRMRTGAVQLDLRKVSLEDVLVPAVLPFVSQSKRILVNGRPFTGSAVEGITLEVDPHKTTRIIFNLVSNAVKHASSEVRIWYRLHNGWFELSVSDDGAGISSEEAARIFDAFYQTEEGIKTGGAGLGLSIVKAFVEAHGGSVWVRPGKGATFGFTMPVASDARGKRTAGEGG